ncbi:O-antigen ligase family protein, partial [Thomasclavelia cocleata]
MIFNRKYYKLCFIIYMFINTLALGYLGIETNYLFIPLLIWALVIIGHDIYKKEFKIKKNYSLLMLVQGFILLLATILNSYSDLNSYVIAIMQLVIYLLIFNNPASMTKKDIVEEVKMIIPLVNVLVGFASLVSIGMFIVGFSSLANGWTLGMVGSRLFGVYFNSNPAAFLACITIVLALIAIRENFKGKPWYLVNIGVQIVYILLTKCRVALIILVVIIIMVGYYFLIRRRPYSMFKRIMLVLGLVFIITSASLLGQGIVEFVPQMQGIASKETSRFQTDKIKEAGHLLISGDIEDFYKGLTIIDEVSNGRVSLTKAALQIWQTDPLIGIGANNFKKIGIQETDVLEYWAVQVVHSHNVFLEALVTTGVIGFIIFVIFFFKCVLMSFNVLKVSQGKEIYFIVQMFIMIVLSEFIGGLSDYGVFYIYSLSATLAWCFLGYLFTYQNII